jgi:hypothetical protein
MYLGIFPRHMENTLMENGLAFALRRSSKTSPPEGETHGGMQAILRAAFAFGAMMAGCLKSAENIRSCGGVGIGIMMGKGRRSVFSDPWSRTVKSS